MLQLRAPASQDRNLLMDLLTALANSLDPSLEIRKSAELQLESCEQIPGYYEELISIVKRRDQVDDSIRTQAIILVKNALDRFWRKTAPR